MITRRQYITGAIGIGLLIILGLVALQYQAEVRSLVRGQAYRVPNPPKQSERPELTCEDIVKRNPHIICDDFGSRGGTIITPRPVPPSLAPSPRPSPRSATPAPSSRPSSAPSPSPAPPSNSCPQVAAHRGGAGHWPENSRTAFRGAVAAGAHYVELDVHLTRDDQPVVIHDPTLQRTTNGSGEVKDKTLAQLSQVTLDGTGGETIPTLGEVLDILKPSQTDILVEIKVEEDGSRYSGIESAVFQALQGKQMHRRARVISFDFNTLLRVHQIAPQIPTHWLLTGGGSASESDALQGIRRVANNDLQGLDINGNLYTKDVENAARAAGVKIGIRAVNDKATYNRLCGAGVEYVFSDNPTQILPPPPTPRAQPSPPVASSGPAPSVVSSPRISPRVSPQASPRTSPASSPRVSPSASTPVATAPATSVAPLFRTSDQLMTCAANQQRVCVGKICTCQSTRATNLPLSTSAPSIIQQIVPEPIRRIFRDTSDGDRVQPRPVSNSDRDRDTESRTPAVRTTAPARQEQANRVVEPLVERTQSGRPVAINIANLRDASANTVSALWRRLQNSLQRLQ